MGFQLPSGTFRQVGGCFLSFFGEGEPLLFRGGCTVQIQKDSEVEVLIDMESVHRGEAKKLRERERSA